jgi:acetyl-CoA decarbonylase/synthase complex subunit gamma
MEHRYVINELESGIGRVPVVSTALSYTDRWEHLLVRMSFRRMDYKVSPGIYAVGNPGKTSALLVSCNYKLSFDILRQSLDGLDAWILVLDTHGVNVWCAAGKGTFGTRELVNRIGLTRLEQLVSHRKLIVPQLGAPGVAAHQVKSETGFHVVYGPVRADDIKDFLLSGMKANQAMRRVNFTLKDRFILTPVEAVTGLKYLVFVAALFLLISGLTVSGYSLPAVKSVGFRAVINLFLAYFAGVILGPLLLPWLPARQFFIKGLFTGLAVYVVSYFAQYVGTNPLEQVAWLFIIPALSSFLTMNFTGASTYTSLSGVRKEMRQGVPLQAIAGIMGVVIWISGRFIQI